MTPLGAFPSDGSDNSPTKVPDTSFEVLKLSRIGHLNLIVEISSWGFFNSQDLQCTMPHEWQGRLTLLNERPSPIQGND